MNHDPPSSPRPCQIDPAIAAEIDRQWDSITRRALRAAYRRTGSADAARDLVQQAFVAIRDGKRKWNPEAQPSLARYVCDVVASLSWSRKTSASERHEAGIAVDYERAPSSAPNPEELTIMKHEG